MLKEVIKAREGFEKLFDEVREMEARLDSDKQADITAAIAVVEQKYQAREQQIKRVLDVVSETETIEVPDVPVATEEDMTFQQPKRDEEEI